MNLGASVTKAAILKKDNGLESRLARKHLASTGRLRSIEGYLCLADRQCYSIHDVTFQGLSQSHVDQIFIEHLAVSANDCAI